MSQPHLTPDVLRARPGDRGPVPPPPVGPHPALPPGPGAGRLVAARGHGRDRRAGRGHPGRGARHGHLLRHAPHRRGRDLRGGGLHQHRLHAPGRLRAAGPRRDEPSGRARDRPRPTGCSPWRTPSAWPTAAGPPVSRSTTASSATSPPRASTAWSTISGPDAWTTSSPITGPSSGSERDGGLRVDDETLAAERAATAAGHRRPGRSGGTGIGSGGSGGDGAPKGGG